VTKFRSISMPAGFRRHLVGKTLINVLLGCHLNSLDRQVNDHVDIFLKELLNFI